ncbi:hypothetical protein [Streptomyces sp. NPDC091268]|uniref:hypothetical protein n=1 Tax=Streptomyces sp. NPDC091268 TaxID=3365979 RepID=UPI0037F26E99
MVVVKVRVARRQLRTRCRGRGPRVAGSKITRCCTLCGELHARRPDAAGEAVGPVERQVAETAWPVPVGKAPGTGLGRACDRDQAPVTAR